MGSSVTSLLQEAKTLCHRLILVMLRKLGLLARTNQEVFWVFSLTWNFYAPDSATVS